MRNPNETGLIIANTATNAEHFVAKIRSLFETKSLLRQLFPELQPELSNRWNKKEACLPREVDHPEATWETAGWDTQVTGRKYDYIIFDDIVDETTYKSPELMAEVEARFEQREGLLRPPVTSRSIIVIGNHWSAIDLPCYIIEKHPEFRVYYRSNIEDGKPIFPEAYTMEWFAQKAKSDPFTYATHWANNPVNVGIAELDVTALQYYKRIDGGLELESGEQVPVGKLNVYGAIDLRHTMADTQVKKTSSRNAIVIAGVDRHGRRFLLEEFASRNDPITLLKKVLELHRKWHPIRFGVESFGYQAALAPLAKEIWKDEMDPPRLELLPRDSTQSKEARIRGGGDFFKDGKGFIHSSHLSFYEEFVSFPGGRTMDVLDAWAWCMTLMRAPQGDDEDVEERNFDREYFRSLHPLVGI